MVRMENWPTIVLGEHIKLSFFYHSFSFFYKQMSVLVETMSFCSAAMSPVAFVFQDAYTGWPKSGATLFNCWLSLTRLGWFVPVVIQINRGVLKTWTTKQTGTTFWATLCSVRPGASTNGGVGRRISHDFKNGGVCHERITLNHHFVRRPLLPWLGLFTSVYAPTSIPPTVPESDIMVIDNKNLW